MGRPHEDDQPAGDAKRLKLAGTTKKEPPQDKSKQPTLHEVLGVAPRHTAKSGKNKRKTKEKKPVAVVLFKAPEKTAASPQTPKKSQSTEKVDLGEADVLTPARHIRKEIIDCASPDGATVHAGTIESPQVITKPAEPHKPLVRTVDLSFKNEGQIARVVLFGPATAASAKILLTPQAQTLTKREFHYLNRKGWLSAEPIAIKTLNITAESIEENKGQPRPMKQDDVMKHTAISHMRVRGLNPKGKTVKYQWGHQLAHTLNAKKVTPKDLEVVGPAANMYESVMTRGLKQAIEQVLDKKNMGHWELRVTSHRIQVINEATRETAYHPHVSHTQEYEYVYVDQAGERSEPLVFKIDPPNPKEVSYEGSTAKFAKIFSAVMQGKSFFDSTQKILDFTAAAPKPAESEEMMDTQEEETLTIHRRKDAKRKTRADEEEEAEDDIVAAKQQVSANKSRAKKRRTAPKPSAHTPDAGRQRSTAPHEALSGLTFQRIPRDGHCFYHAVGLYLGCDFQALRTQVADYIEEHIEEFRAAWPEEKERKTLEKHITLIRTSNAWADQLEIEALQRVTGRPVIIIRSDANPTMPDNLDTYEEEPIFVFYNGSTHYDAMLRETTGPSEDEILTNILKAIKKGPLVTHPGASAQHSKNKHARFFVEPAVYESAATAAATAGAAAAAQPANRRKALKS